MSTIAIVLTIATAALICVTAAILDTRRSARELKALDRRNAARDLATKEVHAAERRAIAELHSRYQPACSVRGRWRP